MPISAPRVHVPARLGVERRHVAASRTGLALEHRLAARRGRRVEAAGRRRRRAGSRAGRSAAPASFGVMRSSACCATCAEAVRGCDRELRRVVEPRVEEVALAVHLEVRDERVPVRSPSPSRSTCGGSRRRDRTRAGSASPAGWCRRAGTPCRRGRAPRRTCRGPSSRAPCATVACIDAEQRRDAPTGPARARRSRRRSDRDSPSRRGDGRCPARTSRRRSSGTARTGCRPRCSVPSLSNMPVTPTTAFELEQRERASPDRRG